MFEGHDIQNKTKLLKHIQTPNTWQFGKRCSLRRMKTLL